MTENDFLLQFVTTQKVLSLGFLHPLHSWTKVHVKTKRKVCKSKSLKLNQGLAEEGGESGCGGGKHECFTTLGGPDVTSSICYAMLSHRQPSNHQHDSSVSCLKAKSVEWIETSLVHLDSKQESLTFWRRNAQQEIIPKRQNPFVFHLHNLNFHHGNPFKSSIPLQKVGLNDITDSSHTNLSLHTTPEGDRSFISLARSKCLKVFPVLKSVHPPFLV